jgi:hypothetical protein
MIEEGRHARPKPGTTGAAFRRVHHLTVAGEYIHAPVRTGMEEARAGATPRQSYRDLCRRSRDPVQEGQSRRGAAATAPDHERAEAHGQRGEDTNLHISDYARTLAAFANADGGCIIFGVRDRPREIVGVSQVIDEAKWADRLREDFAPEVVFATRTYEIAGKILLAIGTDSSPHKPIIARTNRSKKSADKDGTPVVTEAIKDGTIYYRYGGQTRPIGYSELSEMLADRERNRIKSMMENLKVVEKIGIQNVGIVEARHGLAPLPLERNRARSVFHRPRQVRRGRRGVGLRRSRQCRSQPGHSPTA